MTNMKVCDECNNVIKAGEDYVKLQLIKHIGKKQEYSGVGHLCLECLKKLGSNEQ